MKLLPFQKHAFAAAAMTKGLILALEQGLGKTFGAIAVPYAWRARRALIVAPGDLHQQYQEEAVRHFGIVLRILSNIEDVERYRLLRSRKPLRKGQMPHYYLTSYEALTRNGADETPAPDDRNSKGLSQIRTRAIEMHALLSQEMRARLTGKSADYSPYMKGIGNEFSGITCLWKPSLARVLKQCEALGGGFDSIVLDEAVAIQNEDSLTARGVCLLDPEYRMLMTGTPIKNRVESVFTLAWWAAGGNEQPVARWPYSRNGKDTFARQHLEIDRFLTREEEKAAITREARSKIRITRTTARVCNVQRLWRVLAPIMIRVRKADCGEAIVPKTVRPIEVPIGTAQRTVYLEHLQHRPTAAAGGQPGTLHQLAGAGMQITNLRLAALAPDSPSLSEVVSNAHPSRKRSWTPWTPKLASTLHLISELLDQGEQVIVGSPLTHFLHNVRQCLTEADVSHLLLDGSLRPKDRGALAAAFKRADAAVLLAGTAAMARGHSFENCAHLITAAYPWAMDEMAQFVDRIWRLSSKRPITIYPMVVAGTIEERIRDVYGEKLDTSQLSIDGRLFPETTEDIDPERLLAEALDLIRNSTASTTDESTIETAWPALCRRLEWSHKRFREWHPPIIPGTGVTAHDIAHSLSDTAPNPTADFQTAKERFILSRKKPPHPPK